ncbi:major outer membrane protein [Helicobacter sp. MIT 11-5569]|uniref:major outer membrane protein n=1 Tax=Helicobacter sp. MIT 11-5569 TaxID=1548151 RepID=UPI00051FC310|nr:major outer membrane protein [Helicobacter sp. MIT 11-5569]TLD84432.1 major outer membrane protein [Helicobacter sp. MIT 11-5569]
MKKILLSIAVGFVVLQTAQATPLEEAIKGVEMSGMLRYRYTDDRRENELFLKDTARSAKKGTAKHQWRASMDFQTPIIDNISMYLGVLYHNPSQTITHGKNGDGTGNGLGSGKDRDFGVSNFYATYTFDSTNTTIKMGKMVLNTPYNDVLHDRATGIVVGNADLPHWTFLASAYDSFSIDDIYIGYLDDEQSISKPFYQIAAIGSYETLVGNFEAQVWGTNITDILDFGLYSQASFDNGIFSIKGIYAYANLTKNENPLSQLINDKAASWGYDYNNGSSFAHTYDTQDFQNVADLYIIEVGANLKQFAIPFSLRVGYWGNTKHSYTVSLDNEGYFNYNPTGRIWFENEATGVTISMLPNTGTRTPAKGESNELQVFYAVPNYQILENLNIGLEYIDGKNKLSRGSGASAYNGEINFREITPVLVYRLSKQMRLTAYYAMLETKIDKELLLKSSNVSAWDSTKFTQEEKFNRFRFEMRYNF